MKWKTREKMIRSIGELSKKRRHLSVEELAKMRLKCSVGELPKKKKMFKGPFGLPFRENHFKIAVLKNSDVIFF